MLFADRQSVNEAGGGVFGIIQRTAVFCDDLGAHIGFSRCIRKNSEEGRIVKIELDVSSRGFDLVDTDVRIDKIEQYDLCKPQKREGDDDHKQEGGEDLRAYRMLGLLFLRRWFQSGSPLLSA